MRSTIFTDRYERRRWTRALKLVDQGVPPKTIIAKTGVKRSTFFYRLAKERNLNLYRDDVLKDLREL